METVAARASKQRPTRLSSALDSNRNARAFVVAAALIGSAGVALYVGIWHEDRAIVVNRNNYVAAAGLFIAALAMERLTELLIAPWVGSGDRRMDRSIIVGSFALLFGVILSGLLGLRLLALFNGNVAAGSGWIAEHLAPAIDVFATGLAIGAGGKPLHDILSGLEKNSQNAKSASESANSPAPAAPPLPPGGAFGIEIAVTRTGDGVADLTTLRTVVTKLLPKWVIIDGKPPGNTAATPAAVVEDILVHSTTASPPGSSEYVQELFSATHRLHSAGLRVTPLLAPTGDAAVAPSVAPPSRWALARLGIEAGVQKDAKGGRGIKVAVLDTGWRRHPNGVQEVSEDGFDVLTGAASPEDPLVGPDYMRGDLMGAPGHGTGVAAVIAAPGDLSNHSMYEPRWWAESPMIGVAPEATVVPYRVMRGPVHLLDRDVSKGVERARNSGCHVISMSLGGFAFIGLKEAIDDAVNAGIIVVCAAGNQFGVVVEPAIYGNTVAVASIRPDGQPFLDGSSRGPEVAISAPGVKILRPDFSSDASHQPTLDYGTGTTYAAAHVSGAAVLWLAHHGPEKLAKKYTNSDLPKLFLFLLKRSATPWPTDANSPDLAIDWGAGIVNVPALLGEPVFDATGERLFDEAALAGVFRDQDMLAVSSRIAGGVASVLTADGSLEIRSNIVSGLLGAFRKVSGSKPDVRVPDGESAPPRTTPAERRAMAGAMKREAATDAGRSTAEQAGALIRAELAAHTGANANFRRALVATPTKIPIPDRATPELRLVLEETNRVATVDSLPEDWNDGSLPSNWGEGLSLPLRRALQGVGNTTRGYRGIGLIALVLAIVLAVALYSPWKVVEPAAGKVTEATTALGLLVIGVYGGAQAIERLLEFTVGRWAFKDTPGRETDRALILLGVGILIGTLAALVLKIGLLRQVAIDHPDDPWFGRAEVVVTGLAIGGGAKPVHDLLTRIRAAADGIAPR